MSKLDAHPLVNGQCVCLVSCSRLPRVDAAVCLLCDTSMHCVSAIVAARMAACRAPAYTGTWSFLNSRFFGAVVESYALLHRLLCSEVVARLRRWTSRQVWNPPRAWRGHHMHFCTAAHHQLSSLRFPSTVHSTVGDVKLCTTEGRQTTTSLCSDTTSVW